MSAEPETTGDGAPHGFEHLCGWLGSDETQRQLAAELPTLAQAAPSLAMSAGSNDPVLLYRCWKAVFSGYPDYPAQQIGDCVSFGHGHGNDLVQTVEAYLQQLDVAAIHRSATEFIYGESRKVSNNLSRQDGSYGAAAVKAMTEVGVVSYAEMAEAGEATTYSGQRAKSWGLHGPPAAVEAIAGRHKLGAAAQVTTWDELVAAIRNGYPVTICTGAGFTMTRDQQGFCLPRGHWGHCMVLGGIRFDRPGACVLQSWGPNAPQGPTDMDQPPWSFWADQRPIERILAEGDSFALSKFPGFAPKSLPSELTTA